MIIKEILADEQVLLISKVIGTVVPIVVVVLSAIFSKIGSTSNEYKNNLKDYFEKVLCPIEQILRDKTYIDFEKSVLNEIKIIFEKNYYLIPTEMHRRYIEISCEFMENHSLKEKSYNQYKNYINLIILRVRRKLHYPSNYGGAFLRTMSYQYKLIHFVPPVVSLSVYAVCLYKDKLGAAIIFAVITFLYTIFCSALNYKGYKMKQEEWLLIKDKSETSNNKISKS